MCELILYREIAKDVCDVLQKIKNTTQALQSLDDDERSMFYIGCQGEANIISERILTFLFLITHAKRNNGIYYILSIFTFILDFVIFYGIIFS